MYNGLNNGLTFVIFGGTGDLTHRKLIPAIYHLYEKNLLPENFNVVAIGRRDYSTEDYLNTIYKSLGQIANVEVDYEKFNNLKQMIYYYKMDFTNEENYSNFNDFLVNLDSKHNTNGNRLYYLAVSPDYFDNIISGIEKNCMNHKYEFQRLMIEKPFGNDLESATLINQQLVKTFGEENIYRVDHYLGKEMMQNIMVIRFSNIIFESIWNHNYIEQVQITSNETIGVETRGNFYDNTGAIRDMMQSHMMQLLSIIAMDKPKDLSPASIHNEKVKVLKSIKKYSDEELNQNVVRGQYGSSEGIKGYRQEDNVNPNSNTETFVALKLEIDNERWQGVPFYIRTGKRLKEKVTEIFIQFKKPADSLYNGVMKPNLLIIKIQPTEGVFIQFNAKELGSLDKIIPVRMDFCQNCQIGINSPEAYERLLFDAIRGDSTLFARWDEVYESWKFINQIIRLWKNEQPNFPNYLPGSKGPREADELLKKNNHKWLYEEVYNENL